MGLPTQGTQFDFNDGTSLVEVGEVVDITGPTSTRGEIDDTHLKSTSGKEFLLELIDHGEVTLTISCKPGNAGLQALNTAFETEPPPARAWRITLPIDTDASHTTATKIDGTARVSGFEFNIQTDSRTEISVTLRNTGGRTITWGAV